MSALPAPTTRSIEATDLAELEFSDEQITKLQEFKASYDPFSEQFETHHEFQQVQFLKWRYERGEVERG